MLLKGIPIGTPTLLGLKKKAFVVKAGTSILVPTISFYPVGSDCVLYHAYWNGDAVDHSPAGNDGTVTGAAFGALGLTFTANGQYVAVPNDASLVCSSGLSYFFWANSNVQAKSAPKLGWLASCWNAVPTEHYTGIGANPTYQNEWTIFTSVAPVSSDSDLFIDSAWHFYSLTLDGSGNLKFWRDAIQIGSTQSGIGLPGVSTEPVLYLFAFSTSLFSYFGIAGEFLIFNADKSSIITSFYNATKARYGL